MIKMILSFFLENVYEKLLGFVHMHKDNIFFVFLEREN